MGILSTGRGSSPQIAGTYPQGERFSEFTCLNNNPQIWPLDKIFRIVERLIVLKITENKGMPAYLHNLLRNWQLEILPVAEALFETGK